MRGAQQVVERHLLVVDRGQDGPNLAEAQPADLGQRPDQAEAAQVVGVVIGLVHRLWCPGREEALAEIELQGGDWDAALRRQLGDSHG